jgi:hypothetical protein
VKKEPNQVTIEMGSKEEPNQAAMAMRNGERAEPSKSGDEQQRKIPS